MDETNQTKDSLPQGKAPEAKEGTTPTVEAKTYTEDEVKEREKVAVQNALIKAGRDNKSLEVKAKAAADAQQAADAGQVEVSQILEELRVLQKNPDAVAWAEKKKELVEAEKALKKGKAELAKKQAEYDAQIQVVQTETREKAIWNIAAKHTTEATEMADLFGKLSKLNIEDVNQLDELAAAIVKPKETKEIKTDSGVTSGSKTLKGDAALADYFRNKK